MLKNNQNLYFMSFSIHKILIYQFLKNCYSELLYGNYWYYVLLLVIFILYDNISKIVFILYNNILKIIFILHDNIKKMKLKVNKTKNWKILISNNYINKRIKDKNSKIKINIYIAHNKKF